MLLTLATLFMSTFIHAESNIVCPNYWISYGNSCYQFSKLRTTWFHAAKNCSDAGAHLVYIETSQENNFLKSTLIQLHAHEVFLTNIYPLGGVREQQTLNSMLANGATTSTNTISYWTGGNDLAEEGSWVWDYPGEVTFSFTDWSPGEPNNFHHQGVSSEECMQMWGANKFTWNDILCTESDFFICELEDPEVIVG